ncbi:MAG TPA: diaminopimelate decarboxylase [Thermomicrobiales bacterium]|nr:diaminopimelate decarboxylase [Thermomicrobiales bacterium]
MSDSMNTTLWPVDTHRSETGGIAIAGHSLDDLASEYGTPLYVFSEAELRGNCREVLSAFRDAWPNTRVVYAGKAGLNGTLIQVVTEEGLGLDVVSSGELAITLAAGVHPAEISFHGNNKGPDELRGAVRAGVGKIVLDNLDEIDRIAAIAKEEGTTTSALVRLNPGVDVHTHRNISTGITDSKFGFPIANGQARDAVERLLAYPHIDLLGYHTHIGSQLFDSDAYVAAIDEAVAFGAEMRRDHGIEMRHLSPGGGFGIAYLDEDEPKPANYWAAVITGALRDALTRHDMPDPVLTIEPGRSVAGPAGVAVYRVGSIKEIPGTRTYVAVDGGMADNIRPALYEARYTAAVANRHPVVAGSRDVAVVGKYCESGDILIGHVSLPDVRVNDLLAIPACGAYCLPMASNYNGAFKPAVIMVGPSGVRVMKKRETREDLFRNDPVLEAVAARS